MMGKINLKEIYQESVPIFVKLRVGEPSSLAFKRIDRGVGRPVMTPSQGHQFATDRRSTARGARVSMVCGPGEKSLWVPIIQPAKSSAF